MSPEQESELELEFNIYLEENSMDQEDAIDLLNEIKRIYIYLRANN